MEEAIHEHHAETSPGFERRFKYYTEEEVLAERDDRLEEAGAASAMMVLASIEAAFRVDYLKRCYAKRKDPLSRALRACYDDNGPRASFSDQLLETWKDHGAMTTRLVGDIRSAFGYRHWLAHGRYYVAKLGREYDFAGVYNLAREVEVALSLP